jgi:dihydrofolate synthase / folylpolyglutamate synthase
VNYPEVLTYLGKLGNEIETMKFGLDTTRSIMKALGNPQCEYPSVIVAGTNGKGSVASFIHQVLTAAGLNSGIFTSPHLENIEERFRIKNNYISRDEFAGSFSRVLEAADSLGLPLHPTFFELITCTAFQCFAERGVDTAVLEVGMGGRLDSTNIVEPVLSIVTSIGLDHQQYLGDTLALIAGEKAGVFRRGIPALSSAQPGEVSAVLGKKAAEVGAVLEFVEDEDYLITGESSGYYRFSYHGDEFNLGIPGFHQVGNAALALRGLEILSGMGWPLNKRDVQNGISGMRRPGVLEIVRGDPDIILDGGHNPAAAETLREYLKRHVNSPRTLVFGMMKDKDIKAVTESLTNLFDHIFLVPIDSTRAYKVNELKSYIPEGTVTKGAAEALEKAMAIGDTVVVAGSFYLAGEIKRILTRGRSL